MVVNMVTVKTMNSYMQKKGDDCDSVRFCSSLSCQLSDTNDIQTVRNVSIYKGFNCQPYDGPSSPVITFTLLFHTSLLQLSHTVSGKLHSHQPLMSLLYHQAGLLLVVFLPSSPASPLLWRQWARLERQNADKEQQRSITNANLKCKYRGPLWHSPSIISTVAKSNHGFKICPTQSVLEQFMHCIKVFRNTL